MKKIIVLIITFILLFSNFSFNVCAKSIKAPKVSADSAILIDATTGKILYSKNMNTAYPPASTTKIMTALLTLERCNLEDTVKIGKMPPLADGSKIYIFENEKLKVKDLLYALLLASANDCAEALGEHIGGTIENFAKEMNNRAKELGCENTNFVNPSGLYNKNHKTSAKDLSIILKELVKHPEFKKISTTLSYTIPPTNKCKEARPLWNHNKLIQKNSSFYFKGCEGGKTGYTIQSEHSYVASAYKNNQRLIVALVHDKHKTFFEDSISLLNYGFNNFKLVKLYSKGDTVSQYNNNNLNIPLIAGKDFYYVKNKKNFQKPTLTLPSKNLEEFSFKHGDKLFNANIMLNNTSIGKLPLISGNNHELNLSQKIILTASKNNKVTYIYITLTIIALIFIIFKTKKKKLKYKKL